MSFVLPATLQQPQLQRSASNDSSTSNSSSFSNGYATHTASSSGTGYVSTGAAPAETSLAQHEIMAATRVLVAEDNRINQKVSILTKKNWQNMRTQSELSTVLHVVMLHTCTHCSTSDLRKVIDCNFECSSSSLSKCYHNVYSLLNN
jgi:hypothetical protein